MDSDLGPQPIKLNFQAILESLMQNFQRILQKLSTIRGKKSLQDKSIQRIVIVF